MMIRKKLNEKKGFTLIELVIVIAIIAILAALLVPTILAQAERARIATAKDSVNEVAGTMKRFHEDTSYWPYGNTIWFGAPNFSPGVAPTAFTTNDTAMFSANPPPSSMGLPQLPRCRDVTPGMICYNGPYMGRGNSLADDTNKDPWGNPLYFVYLRPDDGFSGGSPQAPGGVVAVWSLGPDGLDQTGCTASAKGSAGCAINYALVAQGLPSVAGADDIIKVAGSTQAN